MSPLQAAHQQKIEQQKAPTVKQAKTAAVEHKAEMTAEHDFKSRLNIGHLSKLASYQLQAICKQQGVTSERHMLNLIIESLFQSLKLKVDKRSRYSA